MKEWLQDPMNAYAVAFVAFWLMVYVFGRKPGLQWLDGEIAKIGAELKTARELRAEAEGALSECKAKQAQAESEARMILEMAKEQVEAMRKQADAELAATLSRQQNLATERIRLAEEKAVNAVRDEAIRMGMDMARKTLTENLAEADATRLLERAIEDIPAFGKAKSKKVQGTLL